MPSISEIRQQYPQYNDMSDVQLADALHAKFYSDMPRDVFDGKVGLGSGQTVAERSDMSGGRPQDPAALQAALQQKAASMQQPSALGKAIEPITSYPAVYNQMNQESRDLMGEGVDQLQKGSVYDALVGVGKTALGGLGYVTSPINAGLRTIVGKPVEENTGIPKEYTEFAAGLALPIPKSLPRIGGATEKVAAPTVAELKSSYLAAKESPEVAAVAIKPEAMASKADSIKLDLNKEWLDPNLAPKTNYIMDRLMNPPEGSTVTMQNVDSARRLLGKMAGRGDEEAAAAQIAKKQLDKWLGSEVGAADVLSGNPAKAQEIMQAGRGDYARAMLGDALDTKIAKAEAQAGSRDSGLNFQNQLRQKLNQFLQNDESRSLTTSERMAIESFVKGSATENTMRYVSKLLGGGGGLGALTSAAVGGAAIGFPGIALPVAGFGLTKLSNVLSARSAEKLSDMIRSNSPLGKQLAGPSQRYEQMATEFQVSPTPRNLARATLAARNLSTNLKDAGITVNPSDLLKSLQGPMTGRAQDEQP